jgi:hypothetical protein
MKTQSILRDLSIEDYHTDKTHLSASSIKEAMKSMKHFNYYRNNNQDQGFKAHFDLGNAFELLLLDHFQGTEEYKNSVIVLDESKRPEQDKGITSKANQEWKQGILNGDKYVIFPKDVEVLDAMLESCLKDATIVKLLSNTDKQVSLFWEDEQSGLKLKSRPDVNKSKANVLVDIKTCDSAAPHEFARSVAKFNYPIQAAIQMRGCVATGLMPQVDKYYWLAVEKKPPYCAQIFEFSPADWGVADTAVGMVLHKIAQGGDAGYSEQADNDLGIITLEMPKYYLL